MRPGNPSHARAFVTCSAARPQWVINILLTEPPERLLHLLAFMVAGDGHYDQSNNNFKLKQSSNCGHEAVVSVGGRWHIVTAVTKQMGGMAGARWLCVQMHKLSVLSRTIHQTLMRPPQHPTLPAVLPGCDCPAAVKLLD